MISRVSFQNQEFLIYDYEELPEYITLIEENCSPISYPNLELISPKHKSLDKKLSSEGIRSYSDLCSAYFLLHTKELQKPYSIRKLVFDKYTHILDEL